MEVGVPRPSRERDEKDFYFKENPDMIADFDTVGIESILATHYQKNKYEIIDARSQPSFQGLEEEPSGVRKGNIEGSKNLFYRNLLKEDGTFKDEEDILKEFKNAGIDLTKPSIHSCQKGVIACVTLMMSEMLGIPGNQKLYIGSWSEYGSQEKPRKSKEQI